MKEQDPRSLHADTVILQSLGMTDHDGRVAWENCQKEFGMAVPYLQFLKIYSWTKKGGK